MNLYLLKIKNQVMKDFRIIAINIFTELKFNNKVIKL